jgi:hypothetical protein
LDDVTNEQAQSGMMMTDLVQQIPCYNSSGLQSLPDQGHHENRHQQPNIWIETSNGPNFQDTWVQQQSAQQHQRLQFQPNTLMEVPLMEIDPAISSTGHVSQQGYANAYPCYQQEQMGQHQQSRLSTFVPYGQVTSYGQESYDSSAAPVPTITKSNDVTVIPQIHVHQPAGNSDLLENKSTPDVIL